MKLYFIMAHIIVYPTATKLVMMVMWSFMFSDVG